jgi:hypothetical protein
MTRVARRSASGSSTPRTPLHNDASFANAGSSTKKTLSAPDVRSAPGGEGAVINAIAQYLLWRFKLVPLILFGMVVAGTGAYMIAGLMVRFGLLDEKAAQLAMTAIFFVALIGGAWAYDRFR